MSTPLPPDPPPPVEAPRRGSGRRYVYYRVPAAQVDAAAAAVQAAQRSHGAGELLRRPGVADGLVTLMEVYPGCDAASERAEAAARVAVAPWLDGGRHVEVFEPIGG